MKETVYTAAAQASLARVVPDLFRGRRLWLILVTKALRIRYRYAVIGFLWAVVQPVAMMLILTFVFQYLLKLKIGAAAEDAAPPYALFLLCALIFWQFTATALSEGTRAIPANADLVKKVCFPREILPLASVGEAFVALLIGCAVLFAFSLAFQGLPPETVVWVPAIFAIQAAVTAGLALLLSAVNTRFRDVQHILDVVLVFGFYATPIFYDIHWARTQFFDEAKLGWLWNGLYNANPMVGIVTAYRGALLDGYAFEPIHLIWPGICGVLLLFAGTYVFRRFSPTLADSL